MSRENVLMGKEAVLARARLLTEFVWTPVSDIPVYTIKTGKTTLPGGKMLKGMLYSSTEPTDKFITENITPETFRTIINNPDSALYNKDLAGHNNSWAYFGVVCNGLVRYALNIQRRYSTKRWYAVPGMRKIADESQYSVDLIEVCDVLYAYGKGRNHVALITDIVRDEKGKVCGVEISEAVRPVCVRRLFTPEEFYEKYKLFALCRYDFVDSVPAPTDSDYEFLGGNSEKVMPEIALDYGNKTNYRLDEDIVISAFKEGKNEIEICKDDKVVEKIEISGRGKITTRLDRGYYTVKLNNSPEMLEFSVNEPQITCAVHNGIITINVNSCDAESEILYMEFREKSGEKPGVFYNPKCSPLSKVEELSQEEKTTGVISRNIPEDAGFFKIYFKNKYGVWTHTMKKIM